MIYSFDSNFLLRSHSQPANINQGEIPSQREDGKTHTGWENKIYVWFYRVFHREANKYFDPINFRGPPPADSHVRAVGWFLEGRGVLGKLSFGPKFIKIRKTGSTNRHPNDTAPIRAWLGFGGRTFILGMRMHNLCVDMYEWQTEWHFRSKFSDRTWYWLWN